MVRIKGKVMWEQTWSWRQAEEGESKGWGRETNQVRENPDTQQRNEKGNG